MKKDKNIAGFLALTLGWLGIHRYYLGQNEWGLSYTLSSGALLWMARIPIIGWLLKFLWIPLIMIISMIDAITFFSMDQRKFDEKYNGIPRATNRKRKSTEREKWDTHRKRTNYQQKSNSRKATSRNNPFKKSGIAKFKEYDYTGAIEDFKKSIEVAPNDIASHFNLACAYSLTENADLAFRHLEKAVALGFKDFEKLKSHHALAYLRIHPSFDAFEENGYKMTHKGQKPEEDLLQSQPNLLDQLKKLGELRSQGLLTETEFEEQKRRLMR